MKQKPSPPLTAMTALAALVVISSTPLAAQAIEPLPQASPAFPLSSLPVAPAPPAFAVPSVESAPLSASKPAPTSYRTVIAPSTRAVEPVSSASRFVPPEVTPQAEATAPAEVAQTRSRPARRATQIERAQAQASPSPTLEQAATVSLDDSAKLAAKPPVDSNAPAASAADSVVVAPSDNFDETLLAALAALFGLGGAAGIVAFSRRRRNRNEEFDTAGAKAVLPLAADERTPQMRNLIAPDTAVPIWQRMPILASLPTATHRSKVRPAAIGTLIEKIDFSNPAGYYEAGVDQRPSPENPFLTRTKRLSRARFLDRQLRLAEDRHLSKSPPRTPQIGRRIRKPELA